MISDKGRARLGIVFGAAAALVLGLTMHSSAQEPATSDSAAEQQAREQPTEQDMVFAAGENLRIGSVTSDDIFAAGNTIVVNGAGADHLYVVGSEISLVNAKVSDIIAAGGKIDLTGGTVTDDVIATGGEISILSDVAIGSSVALTGGTVKIEAAIPGDLRAGAGEIMLNSVVGGDAILSADTIEIGPKARIAGDLEYRSENLILREGAVIVSGTRILPVADTSGAEAVGRGAWRFFLVLGFSILLSYFVVVIALAFAAPQFMRATAQTMQERPWRSLGLGLLIAVLVPVIGILFVWTVVAMPVAILLLAASIALTPVALAVTAYFDGDRARRWLSKSAQESTGIGARLLWPGLGVLALFALTLIPFVGLAIWLLAMLFGLGAVATSGARALALNQ